MDSATFRDWLAQRGCRFDPYEHDERGHGLGGVTIHREGRTATLPFAGSHKPIDIETARQICQALALDWKELPGPMSRA